MRELITAVESLDDDTLLTHFADVVRVDRQNTAELLVHIAEIDTRKLWAKEGYPSMFAMCVEHFLMSEAAAGKRVHAARTLVRFPIIASLVALGEIHVSGINRLAPHLTNENHEKLLGRAKHKTVRQIDELVAEIAPKPDVAARVVRLPERRASPTDDRASEYQPTAQALTTLDPCAVLANEPSPAPSSRRDERIAVAPLSPGRFKLTATIGAPTQQKLEQLVDLLPHIGLEEILDRALEDLLAKTLRRKAALTDKPRRAASKARGRGIPAEIRRAVWERDGGRCAFVSSSGRRCDARHDLEYHHRELYALTRTHDAATIELRCSAHNQYEAEVELGRAFMNRKRRKASCVREGPAVYERLQPLRSVSGLTVHPGVPP